MKLGRHSYIGDCKFAFHPQVTIGNFTGIASGCTFMGDCQHPSVLHREAVASFPFASFKKWGNYLSSGTRGPIVIKNDVWIGGNVTIMDNVTIGNGAIIGIGAIVTKNVPDYAVAVGNPIRIIRMRFSTDIVEELLKIAWWNWSDDKIKDSLEDMCNINVFIERHKI